jgi:hypothetical protein
MNLRSIVLILGGAGIPLALLVMVLPIAWDYGGYNWNPEDGTNRVVFLDPNALGTGVVQ